MKFAFFIPADKANHAIYGALIFAALAVLAMLTSYAPVARGIGMAGAVAAGLAKELYDYAANRRAIKAGQPAPHSVEGGDLAWTAGGALVVWLAASLTDGARA